MARHGRNYPIQARVITPPRTSPPNVVDSVGTTTLTFSSTPVQSLEIIQSTTSTLTLPSTIVQDEVIAQSTETSVVLTSIPAIGFAATSQFGLVTYPSIGFGTESSFSVESVIGDDSIAIDQDTITYLSFTSAISSLQQGGQATPDYIREYLAAVQVLRPDKTYRLIAQRILDRQFLDWDLPVSDVVISYTLSGPKLIKGVLKPEILDFLDLGLEPKATFIHIEQDNIIRGSAILQPGELTDNGGITFVAEGLSGYPHGQPFQGTYSQTDVDPLDVMRMIWSHILSSPRSNLGLTIGSATSPQRIGTEIDSVTNTPRPYTLFWWDDNDCGREIDNLAKETPFDYVEYDIWNTDKTDVEHYIIPSYPRTGHRRFDLAFVAGENIISVALLREEPDQYASEVIVRGAGEGIDSIRGFAANIIGNRIRQAVSVTDKSITSAEAANARAQSELRQRQAFLKIREITVLDKHENASLGDFDVGDDIPVQVELYWFGEIVMWCRIVGFDWEPAKGIITIQLENSEIFNYGIENRIELS